MTCNFAFSNQDCQRESSQAPWIQINTTSSLIAQEVLIKVGLKDVETNGSDHLLFTAMPLGSSPSVLMFPSESDSDALIDLSNDESSGRYETRYGFLTKHVQEQFLHGEICSGRLGSECLKDDKVLSLEASENLDDPLFFWQIYSLTGREPIRTLLSKFYDLVFESDQDWFRTVFEDLSDRKYHVSVQSIMYVDCFGGGRLYFGGESRLDLHHRQTKAMTIMNTMGATRWKDLMVETLDAEATILNEIDPRLRTAINTFLTFFMEKYGREFQFDGSGLVFGETYPPREPRAQI